VKLTDSQSNPISDATVQYYAGGWKDFGVTDVSGVVSKDILPGTYTFRISYGGATLDKKQDISIDPLVAFQTVKARVELKDSTGAALDTGTVQYYAGGWKAFGTTSGGASEKELLSGSYSFRMMYAGGSQDLKQDISTGLPVIFTTGKGVSDTGSCTKYYAGGWKTFSNGMDLLPGSYTFRFSDSTPDKVSIIIAGIENHIH
jgi:hypothetical protein